MKDAKQKAIDKAIKLAVRFGQIDGLHHKQWVIDQMVRALTMCPEVRVVAVDGNGAEYSYVMLGESEAYIDIVRRACDGEDGPDTYSWDTGIAP